MVEVIVWDLLYSLSSPIFEFASRKAITRVQTSRTVDISRHLNGHFRSASHYSQMVGQAGIVHVDMTLTRSKVMVKVTGLLNFRQLAKPCMLAAMTVSPLAGLSGLV